MSCLVLPTCACATALTNRDDYAFTVFTRCGGAHPTAHNAAGPAGCSDSARHCIHRARFVIDIIIHTAI